MLRFRSQPGKTADFREISFSCYPLLMKWALQLTRQDHADAEDLVHDLYVQMAQTSLRHDGIEDMEAYLFSVLRNLHYARLRRMYRSPIDELSILDFDSLQRGLASVDRRQLFDIRVTLGSVCEYVCERKNTSRSAGILILRFFLGYFPSEVMKIAQMTRGAVDQSLQVARSESKLHLDRPGTMVPISQASSSPSSFRGGTQDSLTLFASLREMIFRSRVGECFPAGELARRYAGDAEAGFSTSELAHLVSCRACLDDANEILGLPLLDERSPDETVGRDNSQGPGGRSGPREVLRGKTARSSASDAARRKIKQKTREVFEHRPRELQIAVDGDVRSSQKITAEVSDFYLRLDSTEKSRFIEILSEQKIRIAYLHVTDPLRTRLVEQQELVLLSDDRLLRVTLSHTDDAPLVRVVYHDPVMAQVADAAEVPRPERDCASGNLVQGPASSSGFAQWIRFVIAKVKGFLPDMNPTLATALILAVSSVLCFILWLRQPPAITANTLLNRAERWDVEAQRSGAPGVIYQKIQIKTPRQKLQRELYRDVRGKRHPRGEGLAAQDLQLQELMAAAGVSWDEPLSANSYQAWHDRQHVRSDTITRPGDHLLKLTTTVPAGAVAWASLTVRDTDFHPVERTLEMRGAGTIEIAELSYDVMPWSAAREDWFEPSEDEASRGSQLHDLQPERASLMPKSLRELTEAELDEAELGARLALHDLGNDMSERIDVVRSERGVQVRGIVATEARKREIDLRLNQVPHVMAALYTFDEIQTRQSGATEITSVRQATAVEKSSPLEDFLLPQGISRDEIGEMGHQLFNGGVAVDQEGKAISTCGGDFPTIFP